MEIKSTTAFYMAHAPKPRVQDVENCLMACLCLEPVALHAIPHSSFRITVGDKMINNIYSVKKLDACFDKLDDRHSCQ